MIDRAYLIVLFSHEGIEEVCYLTDDKDKAVEMIKESWASTDEKAQRYCIQEWNGNSEEFICVCREFGRPFKDQWLY